MSDDNTDTPAVQNWTVTNNSSGSQSDLVIQITDANGNVRTLLPGDSGGFAVSGTYTIAFLPQG